MTTYGYARVSTDGQTLDAQIAAPKTRVQSAWALKRAVAVVVAQRCKAGARCSGNAG
jgi:DNA invertase Pin-like site-specific DNA recombinase